MSLNVSDLSGDISQSEIRNMSIECDRLNGINMSQGVCDLELPLEIRSGLEVALNENHNHYSRYDGVEALRVAISNKMLSYNKIYANPKTDIVVSSGATGAFYSTCLALLNRGDEVIVFEPYYGYHVSTLIASGVKPVFVSQNINDWSIDFNKLNDAINKKTKAILVCTPSNPSGRVLSLAEIKILSEIAEKNNLFIFSDEIYEYFIYDNLKHISPGSYPALADRTITISGYSKTFSITGWRIGYSVSNEKWAKIIGYISDLIYVCAPTPLQHAVANGINKIPESYYRELQSQYLEKRNLVCRTLSEIGLNPIIPQGAYYILADVSKLPGKNSKEKAMFLLNKSTVASVPGSAFFSSEVGENYVRFCYAKPTDVINEACRQLIKLKD